MKKQHKCRALALGILAGSAWANVHATTADGLPPVTMDPSWVTTGRAERVSAPNAEEGVFDVLDTFPFSWDEEACVFRYCPPGLLINIR